MNSQPQKPDIEQIQPLNLLIPASDTRSGLTIANRCARCNTYHAPREVCRYCALWDKTQNLSKNYEDIQAQNAHLALTFQKEVSQKVRDIEKLKIILSILFPVSVVLTATLVTIIYKFYYC